MRRDSPSGGCQLRVMLLGAIATLSTASLPAANYPYADAIKYLDHLKTCTPYSFEYLMPNTDMTVQNIIKGEQSGKCQVTYLMGSNSKFESKFECELSVETIELMTRDVMYQQLRSGKPLASADEAANRFLQECRLSRA
jgi:hypothetical protein